MLPRAINPIPIQRYHHVLRLCADCHYVGDAVEFRVVPIRARLLSCLHQGSARRRERVINFVADSAASSLQQSGVFLDQP